jgi:hypothetical protein
MLFIARMHQLLRVIPRLDEAKVASGLAREPAHTGA